MSIAVLVVSERVAGEHPDVTFELLGKGRELAGQLGGELAIAAVGDAESPSRFAIADRIYAIEGEGLEFYSASAWEFVLSRVVEAAQPKVVLMSTGTLGLDLAGPLALKTGAALASYGVDISLDGSNLVVTSQLYGGKLMSESSSVLGKAVVTVIPGSFPADSGKRGGNPAVEMMTVNTELASVGAAGRALGEPESSGVDITAAPMLVSVGRGIGSESNLELVQELADCLKVPLSASRPIIDQGWLPKPHQVGKSGKKVKPSIYLCFGISGAPEHLEGMRNTELIIACNTDAKAPIFEVAHYGTTVDLFDLVPELTEMLGG